MARDDEPYYGIPGRLLFDPNMSATAKVLWVQYRSAEAAEVPWHVDNAVVHNREGLTAVRTALAALVEAGWLERVRARDIDGRMAGVITTTRFPDDDKDA